MPNLMPSDIVDEVEHVLVSAHCGKGTSPNYLTAFQILERLSPATQDRVIAERTAGGANAGTTFAAPSVVSKAARLIPGVQIEYMDCVGLSVRIAGQDINPSNEVCGLYRLPPIYDDVA